MSDLRERPANKNTSLADLNKIVTQQEDLLGPLVKISNSNDQTILTFDMAQDPPTVHAQIATTQPANTTKVAEGQIYISGKLGAAVAFRAS
jgi:hypothetical protein